MSTFTAIVRSAFDWTWRTSLQASVLIILVLLLQRLLRRWLTPRLRYALSLLVLCRLLLPVAPPSALSFENLLAPSPQPAQSSAPPTLAAGSIPESATLVCAHGWTLGSALSITWFCGLLILGGFAVWRYYQWRLRIRSARQVSEARLLQILDDVRQEVGIRRPVRLASLADLGSPAVFGFWRLHLLLPETSLKCLSDPEWRLVFLHEMTHIRNCDTVLNTMLIAVQFLHWFNPLVWIGLHRLRADRELVCDAIVVERLEASERLGYAQVLLRLAEALSNGPRVFPSAVPVVNSASEIKRRVTMIKYYRGSSRALRAGVVVCILLLGLLTFTRAREGDMQTERDGRASRLSRSTQQDVESLIMHEFKTAGYSLPESVLDDLVQETVKNEYGDRATLTESLRDRGVTFAEFREQIREKFITEKLRAQSSLTNIATNDQRALGFDWYLGNFLMTSGRVPFPGGMAPTLNGAPSTDNFQGFFPGTAPGSTIAPDASNQLITSGLRNTPNAPAIGAFTGILTVEGETNAGTNQGPSPQKVGAIEIRYVGPKLVKEAEVRDRIRAQVGKPLNTVDIDADVRNLYATGLFYNVRVSTRFSPKGLDLIYNVQCSPRIAKLGFTGNSKLGDAQLQELIGSKVGDVFNERKSFSDTQAIQKAYERAGYQGPEVKYSFDIDQQAGKASVAFEIKERN